MGPLSPGQLIPEFSLPASNAEIVRISDFRGRRSLVLVFAGTGDRRCFDLLRELATYPSDIEYNEAKIVLILARAASDNDVFEQTAAARFTLLLDEDGGVHRRFGAATNNGTEAAVYITDRYGEIYAAYRTSDGTPLPDADSVLKSLAHLLAECPE
jgi:peroxiredoxin